MAEFTAEARARVRQLLHNMQDKAIPVRFAAGRDGNDAAEFFGELVRSMPRALATLGRLEAETTRLRSLLKEALEGLAGVIAVADRKTVEFDKARALADRIRTELGG